MKKLRYVVPMAVAMLGFSACSQEAETPSNEEAAADTNTMMMDPSNPYAQAEMQMMERMEAGRGSNPSETWALKMIEHHRGAITMSEVLLAQGGDPQVLDKARMTADMQQKEIDELLNLLRGDSSAGTAPAEGNPFAEATTQMHQQMMAAQGDNLSELWLRKMIAHHRGGASMSDVLISLGGDPEVVAKARQTRQKQSQEAAELERMLSGQEAPSEAPPTATATSVPSAPPKAAGPAPKAEAKAETPPPAEEPAVDPHAGHDMNNM